MTHTLRAATLLVATLYVLPASPLVAQSGTPEYAVSALPMQRPDDDHSVATGINDAGQVVGRITGRLLDDNGALWDHGTVIPIGGLVVDGQFLLDSTATDINERGQVIGYAFHTTSVAFLWEGGTMTKLDALGGQTQVDAINDAGQIVGFSSLAAFGGGSAAVMWSGGVAINLGTSSFSANATAINNRGQIIGFNFFSPPNNAFLWDNGVLSELPLTSATDINDRGQILGLSDGRPVIWTYGLMTPLALPPGEWHVTTAAINELGHAVGTITSTAPGAVSMAVLWRDGTIITLPGLAASDFTVASDLNNRDEIVGRSGRRASLWVPQTPPTTTSFTEPSTVASLTQTAHPAPMDLGTLGGTYSTPTGINDEGMVVGSSTTAAREQHAFVWTPTNGMADLGTLGDRSASGTPLRTSLATAVNDAGQVVGASYEPRTSISDGYRAFLWTRSAGMQNLGTLAGGDSYANAINGAGQVVGRSGGRAVSWPRRVARWTSARSVDARYRRWPSPPSVRSPATATSETSSPPRMRFCGARAAAWWTWARWADPRVQPRR